MASHVPSIEGIVAMVTAIGQQFIELSLQELRKTKFLDVQLTLFLFNESFPLTII